MLTLNFLLLFLYFCFGNATVQKCDTIFTTLTLIPDKITSSIKTDFNCEPFYSRKFKKNLLSLQERTKTTTKASNPALSLTATYNLLNENNITYFSIQKLTVLSFDYHFKGVTGVCSIGASKDDKNCTTPDKNFALKLPVNITKMNLNLELTTPEDDRDYAYEVLMTYLIIDEGSFNMPDGSLFSAAQPAYTMTIYDGFLYTTYINYTCTSFKDINELQTNPPKCKSFKSRTTFYNVDDNYSIYATIFTNYSLTQDSILLNTFFTGPSNVFIKINSNDYCICETFEKNCSFSYSPEKDAKIMFFLEYDDFQSGLEREILSGRIIVRNGNTLAEEGKAFSTQNDCIYFKDTLTSSLVSTSEFCCTSFEDNFEIINF